MAIFIILVTSVIGIAYGLVLERSFTLGYAFSANFVVAALLIASGLLYPVIPKRLTDKLRSKQLFEYKMHMEYMQERATRQEEGYRIMWIGIAVAMIAGLIEILLWLLR